ncbi:MAG: DNA mismatch repair endonuclease MutL [Methylocystaceae bacterium]
MTIRVLNDRLINQIAAGEVVERPASVVKELVENSLDAGATQIEVEIIEGGRGIIRVMDNGTGISAREIELAFTRHATSKLASESDLDAIMTMGFRGEALPSIASVAKIRMVSSIDGIEGYALEIAGGSVTTKGIHASPLGTMIEVRDLFYNVPARLKFLKSTVTESLQVHNTVFKLSVAHPEVAFSYRQNERLLFKTPGNNQLEAVLGAVKGNNYSEGFLKVKQDGEYQVWGLTSRPEIKRKNRREEMFFVNRRPVHSPLLLRAIDEAYRGRLISGEFPACYLQLDLPPSEIDVNVHPQKSEVRFRDEDRVFKTVAGAVRYALDSHNKQTWQTSQASTPIYQSSHEQTHCGFAESRVSYVSPAALDFTSLREPVSVHTIPDNLLIAQTTDFLVLGQMFDSYIMVASGEAFLLVDQHAADESLRYHELINNTNLWQAQDLLLPVTITVGKRRIAEFDTIQEQLAKVGFLAEVMGDELLILRSAPAIAQGREEEIFGWLLDDLFTGELGIEEKEFFRQTVASLACHQAVKARQRLNKLEMEDLVKRLIGTPEAAHCPHGRPTYIGLAESKVAEWFKR